ncbi:hypothetical protein SAMN02745823_02515 [Sporobacter termitidis DSM 10068]|uniref:Uncharacterized protein n=1 Tax=Sporobacter termitidis DSM 10068 TaxID=1123282 RepID=A0A1M5YGT1_9FIRM|nr:hypothetical protein [Sporobacter termitidis]SHI11182.1 hypothetical protein SAMN02745823_02515 [Sporobacter termitidis DSM 10068]
MGGNNNGISLSGIPGFDDTALTGLFALPPAQMSLLATVLGLVFIDGLDTDQQNVLGNFFMSVGQSIATAAAQSELIQANSDPTKIMQRQIQALRKEVQSLARKVNRQ